MEQRESAQKAWWSWRKSPKMLKRMKSHYVPPSSALTIPSHFANPKQNPSPIKIKKPSHAHPRACFSHTFLRRHDVQIKPVLDRRGCWKCLALGTKSASDSPRRKVTLIFDICCINKIRCSRSKKATAARLILSLPLLFPPHTPAPNDASSAMPTFSCKALP